MDKRKLLTNLFLLSVDLEERAEDLMYYEPPDISEEEHHLLSEYATKLRQCSTNISDIIEYVKHKQFGK